MRNDRPHAPRMPRPARVLHIIARMNVGGPAYCVSILAGRLDHERFRSLLVHGKVGPGEASFASLAQREGCHVEVVEQLSPEIRPVSDARALVRLVGVMRRFQPQVVHTHTAKAGMLGRTAAMLAGRPRPLIVHTYHGHVLEGYFSAFESRFYRAAERGLARISDCLIGVSDATVADLVRLGVAPRERFRTIPIGLDLDHFAAAAPVTAFRRAAGVRDGELLLASVGRLVPIKRVDVLLRAVARLRGDGVRLRLIVVGDGECRRELESLAAELRVDDVVTFAGYMQDVTEVAAAADIAVLSSDNEGTPVSLIEAGAAGRPAVATAVGGVPDVVVRGVTGLLVPPGDDAAFADALRELVTDPALRVRMGSAAREHVLEGFSSARYVRDVEALYEELLTSRGGGGQAKAVSG